MAKTLKEVLADPNFRGLPGGEQVKVMLRLPDFQKQTFGDKKDVIRRIDPNFRALSNVEQNRVLNRIGAGVIKAEPPVSPKAVRALAAGGEAIAQAAIPGGLATLPATKRAYEATRGPSEFVREKLQPGIDKILPEPETPSVATNIAGNMGRAALGIGADTVASLATPEGLAMLAVPLAKPAATMAEKVAVGAAQRALGFTKRFLNTTFNRQAAKTAAKESLDQGVIGAFSGPGKMLDTVMAKKETAGEAIGEFLKNQKTGLSLDGIVSKLQGLKDRLIKDGLKDQIEKVDAAIGAFQARAAAGGAADPLMGSAAASGGQVNFLDASRLKTIFQMRGKFNKDDVAQATERAIAGTVREHIDESLELASKDIINKEQYQKFLRDKRIYGAMTRAEEGLINRLSSIEGNRALGILDVILAAPQVAMGNPLAAIATVGVKHAADAWGATMTATAARSMAQMLQKLAPGEIPLILKSKTAFLAVAGQVQKEIDQLSGPQKLSPSEEAKVRRESLTK